MPAEDLDPAIELFRHRFLHALREAKLISPGKLADLLSWKHSGFHIHDGGEKPVPAHDSAGRKRLAEYLLRHPFSLQKITWNASTQTVIYRSKRHHTTKRNFEIFKAPDFIAAAFLHLPPKGQQTVRYYGTCSNKTRGQTPLIPDRIIRLPKPEPLPEKPPPAQILLIPAPPKQSARDMRPLWRDLILKTWGGDPLQCPCCKGTMKPVRKVIRREEIQFFLRLHGLWEGIVTLPRPPPPPFDIEKRRRLVGVLDGGVAGARRVSPPAGWANQTMEPIVPPWQAIKEWIPDEEPDLDWFNRPLKPSNSDPEGFDQSPTWQAPEIQLDDGRILVLEYTCSARKKKTDAKKKAWQSGLESYAHAKSKFLAA